MCPTHFLFRLNTCLFQLKVSKMVPLRFLRRSVTDLQIILQLPLQLIDVLSCKLLMSIICPSKYLVYFYRAMHVVLAWYCYRNFVSRLSVRNVNVP